MLVGRRSNCNLLNHREFFINQLKKKKLSYLYTDFFDTMSFNDFGVSGTWGSIRPTQFPMTTITGGNTLIVANNSPSWTSITESNILDCKSVAVNNIAAAVNGTIIGPRTTRNEGITFLNTTSHTLSVSADQDQNIGAGVRSDHDLDMHYFDNVHTKASQYPNPGMVCPEDKRPDPLKDYIFMDRDNDITLTIYHDYVYVRNTDSNICSPLANYHNYPAIIREIIRFKKYKDRELFYIDTHNIYHPLDMYRFLACAISEKRPLADKAYLVGNDYNPAANDNPYGISSLHEYSILYWFHMIKSTSSMNVSVCTCCCRNMNKMAIRAAYDQHPDVRYNKVQRSIERALCPDHVKELGTANVLARHGLTTNPIDVVLSYVYIGFKSCYKLDFCSDECAENYKTYMDLADVSSVLGLSTRWMKLRDTRCEVFGKAVDFIKRCKDEINSFVPFS
jgi:hypothetical protein